jgi:F-type H+-transporting ATPase subunit b
MNKRSENIKESMESAKKQEQEALELKRKLHIELKKIENEKKMILDKFQTLGKQRKEEIVKEAIEDAKNIKKRALDDIMHEEFKAKENIKAQIIDLSFLIASRFISKNIEDDDSLKLLDDALVILEEINYV